MQNTYLCLTMKYNKFTIYFAIIPTLLCSGILFSSFGNVHKYYFSLSEIKADTRKENVEISCKLFTDDIEDALLKIDHKAVDLERSEKNETVQQLVSAYFYERFKISINGVPLKLDFVGFETENDVTWFYLEAKLKCTVKSAVKIKVTNMLLYDFLPEQTNLINFIWNDKDRIEKLVNPDKEMLFEF